MKLSNHFQKRKPSDIRLAQIEFMRREDQDRVKMVNTAIGNVSLPMHPAMQERMFNLKSAESPFSGGVVKYSPTVGLEETNQAFLNIIASSGLSTQGLHCQVTDGGSQAMELVILGVCGDAGTSERPLMMIDAAYTNYMAFCERVGRSVVSVQRRLQTDGTFTLPNRTEMEEVIKVERPGALVVIPYDNPTGQYYSIEDLISLAQLAVKYDLWIISDEAYRELHYTNTRPSSIWALTEEMVPGITGRRISIETASKVWNACGLRIGALVTDNLEFHRKAVFENTAGLCSNTIGQYIFGALAHIPHSELQQWYKRQRAYYLEMLLSVRQGLQSLLPEIIVSRPDASIYSVLDVRRMVPDSFDALDFVMYCARKGKVAIDGQEWTLLLAPMAGFYNNCQGMGKTEMRVAFVETPDKMKLMPQLFKTLLERYLAEQAQEVDRLTKI